MRNGEAREAGCVWTEGGQRLQVVVRGGEVEFRGMVLTRADREAFARVFFAACAEADGQAPEEAAMPP